MSYYAVVTWGFHNVPTKSYYRSLKNAKRDAYKIRERFTGVTVHIVECETQQEAMSAMIVDNYPVVMHV